MLGDVIAAQRQQQLRQEADRWRIKAAIRERNVRSRLLFPLNGASLEEALPSAERRRLPPGDLPRIVPV